MLNITYYQRNVNQNHHEVSSHNSQKQPSLKSLETINGEGVEKRELSCTVCWKANWYSHCEEKCGDSLKNWEYNCHYEPAIPLLTINIEETRIGTGTCTTVLITALFTIARTWKQPRCPSADEWIRKLWHIYTTEYYSATKGMHLSQF